MNMRKIVMNRKKKIMKKSPLPPVCWDPLRLEGENNVGGDEEVVVIGDKTLRDHQHRRILQFNVTGVVVWDILQIDVELQIVTGMENQ